MRFFVYILANSPHGRLYIGRTSDLRRRVWEHRNRALPGYTARHAIATLVYFETHETLATAWHRERSLKRWRRDWKFNLIERDNPHWQDLASAWFTD
ncbi:MAG: GIY-YIG nuclease family protein [Thalassobaculum sp.]